MIFIYRLTLITLFISSGICAIPFMDYVHAHHVNKADLRKVNSSQLLKFVKQLSHKKRTQLTLGDICVLHKYIYQGVSSPDAGKLRKNFVRINGMIPPAPSRVGFLMNQLLKWLHTAKGHPLKICVDFHLKFVDIHPFRDGNGRTARTLLAILLLQHGYPLPTFLLKERHSYCTSINKALLRKDRRLYYQLMFSALRRSFNDIKNKF